MLLSGDPLVGWDDGPEGEPSAPINLPMGSVWTYLDDGSDQGAAWRALGFDDSGWVQPGGSNVGGQYGYGDGDEATIVLFGPNPDNDDNDEDNKFATTYFRYEFNIPTGDAAEFAAMTINLIRDDGAIVYVNGQEVDRQNLPDGPIAYDDYTGSATPNGQENDPRTIVRDLTQAPYVGLLQDGPNILAVEIHQANLTSSDLSFDLSLDLTGELPSNNEISGTLGADTVLTKADSPWRVIGDVTVPAGVTLSIEPGATVEFDDGTGITVEAQGRLVAEGMPWDRILMTGTTTAEWDGIIFDDTMEDNRLVNVDLENGDGRSHVIDVTYARLLIDGMTFADVNTTIVEVHHPSLIVRNSHFPSVNGETLHGTQIEGDEYFIVDGNVFAEGGVGAGDTIDFLGSNRPGPVFQVLNNVFLGGGDDGIDMDGTDAHVEGNVFMNFHWDQSRTTTSNAIATGRPQSGPQTTTEITVVRNIFIDNDHAILLKEDAFATIENNVFIGMTEAAIQFNEVNGSSVDGPGLGAYIDGNIFWDNAELFKDLVDDENNTSLLTVHRSIMPDETVDFDGTPIEAEDFGEGNIIVDPTAPGDPGLNIFADPAAFDYRLAAGSPAIGNGPDGLDIGAMVPPGPIITGVPTSPSPDRDQVFGVTGPGITHYRYRLNDGPLSPVTPVETPLSLTALENATHTLEVFGANSAGEWFAGPVASFGINREQIIAPTKTRTGEMLPMIVRVYDHDDVINTLLSAPVELDNAADLDATALRVKKGVASLSPVVTAAADFSLALTDDLAAVPGIDPSSRDVDVLDGTFPVQTYSGTLAGNTVWDASVERRITADLTIPDGSTLTIEPGTRVLLGDQVNLMVDGEITVNGTLAEPVLFNSIAQAEPWGGIELDGATGTFTYTFLTNAAADSSRNFGHSSSQPVIMVDDSTLDFTDSFILNTVGKAFGSQNDAIINLDRIVLSNVDTGAQFNSSQVTVTDSYIKDVPTDDRSLADDDNDGFYFNGAHSNGQPSRFQDSFIITTEDDGIDQNGAYLEVIGSWIEGAYHEGIATSNGNTVTILDTVFSNNEQGVELGWAGSGQTPPAPDVYMDHSVSVRNDIGIRFGDSYDWTYMGNLTAKHVVAHDNAVQNIHEFANPGSDVRVTDPLDITYSVTNDPDFDADTGNITGVPVFGPNYHLLRGSVGLQAGEGGADMGRLFTPATAAFVIDNQDAILRIDEVLADNVAAVEHEGTYPDMIELYNAGGIGIPLEGVSVTDDPLNPTKYVFGAGATLDAGQRLVLFANQPDATSGTHLGFELDQRGGGVYVYDAPANGSGLLDSVEFGIQLPDLSVGRIAPLNDFALTEPRLGDVNVAVTTGGAAAVKINELLPDGQILVTHDFVELFNTGAAPVDIGGLYLTDEPATLPDKHQLAPLSFVAGDGFTVLVADGNTAAGGDHLNFTLPDGGASVGLLTDTLVSLDEVTYPPQPADVSFGRAPDGTANLTALPLPTPGLPNQPIIGQVQLVAEDDVWSYFDTGDPGADWETDAFDDSTWPTGPGVLGFPVDETLPAPWTMRTTITRGEVTLYFRRQFTLAADPANTALQLTMALDDGAVVYLNGHEIHRHDLDDGPVDHLTEANTGDSSETEVVGPLAIPSTWLVQGDNLLAVEVHQMTTGSSDLVFGLTLDAELTEPTAEYDDEIALLGGLRVTEIMYNPDGGDQPEFIELQNVGSTALNLDGVRLADGVAFTFPAMTLDPNQYVVVVGDQTAFEARYGTGVNVAGQYAGDLDDDGDSLAVLLPTPLEVAVQRFAFDDLWYPTTDGGGNTLVIRDPAGALPLWNEAAGWQAGVLIGGTPGQSEDVPAVTGRFVFYSGSAYDATSDDDAIASDKQALRPGQTATFANYTSYAGGVNGVMIDLENVPNIGALLPTDFAFHAGNTNDPSSWATVAASNATSRPGEGVDGADRIVFYFDQEDVQNTWLQVTVAANERTGLLQPDVFYFGNAVGETGNDAGNALVTAADVIGIRDNPRGAGNRAGLANPFDVNRDRLVNAADAILARNHAASPFDALRLIQPTPSPAPPPGAEAEPVLPLDRVLGTLSAASPVARRTERLDAAAPVHDARPTDSGAVAMIVEQHRHAADQSEPAASRTSVDRLHAESMFEPLLTALIP